MADAVNQGASGVLNEHLLGDDRMPPNLFGLRKQKNSAHWTMICFNRISLGPVFLLPDTSQMS